MSAGVKVVPRSLSSVQKCAPVYTCRVIPDVGSGLFPQLSESPRHASDTRKIFSALACLLSFSPFLYSLLPLRLPLGKDLAWKLPPAILMINLQYCLWGLPTACGTELSHLLPGQITSVPSLQPPISQIRVSMGPSAPRNSTNMH